MYSNIPEAYPVDSIEAMIQTVQRPYTPEQRTSIVSDILNFAQEVDYAANDPMDHDEWDEKVEHVSNLSDKELDEHLTEVHEWVLSRQDIPIVQEDQVAISIANYLQNNPPEELPSVSEPVLIHQQFKRFSDDLIADYGYLGYKTYRHASDPHEAQPQ